MNYLLHLLILFDIYLVVALSLNIIVGYVGLLTLAHAAYFGIGAYAYGLTTLVLGWGFIPAALLAIGTSAVLSAMMSIASWRFRGDFFVLISLAIQVMVFTVLKNWHDPLQPLGTISNMTNGDFGLNGVPAANIFGYVFDQKIPENKIYDLSIEHSPFHALAPARSGRVVSDELGSPKLSNRDFG